MISHFNVFFFANNFNMIAYDFLTLCCNIFNVLLFIIAMILRKKIFVFLKMSSILQSIDFRRFLVRFFVKLFFDCYCKGQNAGVHSGVVLVIINVDQ